MDASAGGGRSLAAFVAASAAVLVAGCSTSSPSGALTRPSSPSVTPAQHSSSSPPAASESCKSTSLSILVGNARTAAGKVSYPIRFQNISATPCTLSGFPAVSFISKNYLRRVGSPAKRNRGSPPHLITVPPEGTAIALISVVNADKYPGACDQTQVGGILVNPPRLTHPVRLPLSALTCANPKYHVLTVNALVQGPPAVGD
ncbi:MAG TPA: DUF4232 domain-containing protein [Streptosporangiaceae bacterium]|nr:DUF4232 domain-containing protein [Streptosporangiaceae bacterium]